MKILKFKLLVVILLFTTNFIIAQNKSEAEFLKMSKEYKLNEDGSYDMRCVKQVKYITHMSFNSLYGETFIVYNPEYQKLTINESYTIQADGKRVETPRINAFNEVLPRFAADAPYYNHLREMVITHTGLELGATVYLDYTLHTKAGYTEGLLVNEVLQETSPIKEYSISIEYPKNISLLYNQYNFINRVYKEKGDRIAITWTAKNIPARLLELYQPTDNREAPRVAFTTIKGERFADLLLSQFTSAGSAIQTKVNELIKNKTTNNDKAKVITDYVVNNISFVNIPLQYIGYKLRSVDDVYKTAYGTAIEKTALLSAMLNAANIEATPAITTPSWTGNGAGINLEPVTRGFSFFLPEMNEFPVLLGSVNGEYKYISPLRSEPFMWSDMGKDCYTLKQSKKIPALMQGVDINYSYSINAEIGEKSDVKFEFTKNGTQATVVTGENKINVVNENDKEAKALTVSVNNGYYAINLPSSNLGVATWRMTQLSAEPHNALLEIPYPISESYTYSCTLPDGMKYVNKTSDIKKTNAVGEVIITILPVNKTITIRRSIKLNTKIIAPKDYKAFKELMDIWNTSNYQKIVIN